VEEGADVATGLWRRVQMLLPFGLVPELKC
jgi:hypothetical protein